MEKQEKRNKITEIIVEGHKKAIAIKLWELGKASPTHLAREIKITVIFINQLLKELINANLVEKVPKNPSNDQRIQEYRLTKSGRLGAHFAKMFNFLSPELRDEVISYGELLTKKIEKVFLRGNLETEEREELKRG